MTSFFGGIGNPFATPVGQRIEQATDASLASENWALNIEICDLINEMEDGPKDAIKAIRKRLQQNAGKNYTVVMYTLTVLETCVKNCGRRLHVFACSKEFIQELVKLIGPKNDPPTAVQEKVLSLIQSWADAFRHQAELLGVVQVYHDLKQKGIEFPMTDLDTMAPIHTPQRSIPDGEAAVGPPLLGPAPQLLSAPPSPAVIPPGSPAPPQAPTVLTSDQVGKLQSELDVVQGNMSVLSEMLSELTPGKEHPSDRELLDQLHGTCRAMQQRLVELIGKLANDQLTAELLRVNDELNNLFLRYTRFENNRESPTGQVGSRPAVDVGAASLIDLSDEAASESAGAAAVANKLSGLAIAGVTATSQLGKISSVSAQKGSAVEKEDSEFDMFAQSRNVTYESSKTGGSTYEDNLPDQMSGALGAVAQTRSQPAPTMHKESDFDEMAAWLEEAPPAAVAGEESLTSSEFERFLAERAAAADALPSVPTTQPARSHHHRQLNKEPEAEASMFAL